MNHDGLVYNKIMSIRSLTSVKTIVIFKRRGGRARLSQGKSGRSSTGTRWPADCLIINDDTIGSTIPKFK